MNEAHVIVIALGGLSITILTSYILICRKWTRLPKGVKNESERSWIKAHF